MDIKASCCIRRPDSARTWSQNKAEALKIKLVSFYVAAFRNNFYFCCYTSTTGRCYMCKNENLYVDEVLAVLDDVDVGIVDGLFMVFDASRPIWSWAQDLREHRLAMGISHRLCFLSLRGNFTDKIYYLFMFISAFTKKLETVPCEHVSIFGYQLVGIPIYSHILILFCSIFPCWITWCGLANKLQTNNYVENL